MCTPSYGLKEGRLFLQEREEDIKVTQSSSFLG